MKSANKSPKFYKKIVSKEAVQKRFSAFENQLLFNCFKKKLIQNIKENDKVMSKVESSEQIWANKVNKNILSEKLLKEKSLNKYIMSSVDWINDFNEKALKAGRREMLWFPIKLSIYDMIDDDGNNVMENGEKKMKKDIQIINHKMYHNGVKKVGFDDFKNMSVEDIRKRQKLLTGKKVYGFTHIAKDTRHYPEIDIDSNLEDSHMTKFEKMKEDNVYFKSATKSYGYHIIMEKSEDCEEKRNCVSLYKTDKKNLVEGLNGQWSWIPLGTEIMNTEKELIKYKFEDLMVEKKKPKKKIIIKESPIYSDGEDEDDDDDKIVEYKYKSISNGMNPSGSEFLLSKSVFEPEDSEPEPVEPITQLIQLKKDEEDKFKFEEVRELLNLISPEYRDYYPDFIRIIFALKNVSESLFADAVEFTKKSPKAREDVYDYLKRLWDKAKNGCNIGTINYYAKKSNPTAWSIIKRKYCNGIKTADLNDDDMALRFINYIYKQGQIYCFHNSVWYHDKSKHKLKHYVGKVMKDFYTEYQKDLLEKFDKGKAETDVAYEAEFRFNNKLCGKLIDRASSTCSINSITERVVHHLSVKNYGDVKFDERKELLPFTNGVYDLQNNGFVEKIRREDYILTTTGYEYQEPTEKQINEVKDLLTQIFPDPLLKSAYLNVLATCLWGKHKENFCIANGSGGNGKGVLNDLMIEVLGNNIGGSYEGFAYKAKNCVLLLIFSTNPLFCKS